MITISTLSDGEVWVFLVCHCGNGMLAAPDRRGTERRHDCPACGRIDWRGVEYPYRARPAGQEERA